MIKIKYNNDAMIKIIIIIYNPKNIHYPIFDINDNRIQIINDNSQQHFDWRRPSIKDLLDTHIIL